MESFRKFRCSSKFSPMTPKSQTPKWSSNLPFAHSSPTIYPICRSGLPNWLSSSWSHSLVCLLFFVFCPSICTAQLQYSSTFSSLFVGGPGSSLYFSHRRYDVAGFIFSHLSTSSPLSRSSFTIEFWSRIYDTHSKSHTPIAASEYDGSAHPPRNDPDSYQIRFLQSETRLYKGDTRHITFCYLVGMCHMYYAFNVLTMLSVCILSLLLSFSLSLFFLCSVLRQSTYYMYNFRLSYLWSRLGHYFSTNRSPIL